MGAALVASDRPRSAAAVLLASAWIHESALAPLGVVALFTAVHRPIPAPLVDELHVVLRKTTAIDLASLRAYVDLLREGSTAFGPAERFLIQRIEGLERLAALK